MPEMLFTSLRRMFWRLLKWRRRGPITFPPGCGGTTTMIWLWRICFRRWGTHAQVTNLRHKRLAATAMMSLWLCAAGNAVTVSGTVQLRESRIASVARGKDYSGVVISLEPVNAPASVAPGKHVTMLQKDKMFTPHILPLMA